MGYSLVGQATEHNLAQTLSICNYSKQNYLFGVYTNQIHLLVIIDDDTTGRVVSKIPNDLRFMVPFSRVEWNVIPPVVSDINTDDHGVAGGKLVGQTQDGVVGNKETDTRERVRDAVTVEVKFSVG